MHHNIIETFAVPATPAGAIMRAAAVRPYTPRDPSPALEVEALVRTSQHDDGLSRPPSRSHTRASASSRHLGRRSGAASSASTQFMPRSSTGMSPEDHEGMMVVLSSGPASPSVEPHWLPSARETPCPPRSEHRRTPSVTLADTGDVTQAYPPSPRQSPALQAWRWGSVDPVRSVVVTRAEASVLTPLAMPPLATPEAVALNSAVAEVKTLHERECRHYAAVMRLRDCENDPMVLTIYRDAKELDDAITTTRAAHHRELMSLLSPAVRC